MKVTGHKTASMFKRYADLFTDAEQQARPRSTEPPPRMAGSAAGQRPGCDG